MRRAQLAERERHAALGELAAQHVHGAVLVEYLRETPEQAVPCRSLSAGEAHELVPLLGLSVGDKADHVVGVQSRRRVVAPRVTPLPTASAGEFRDNEALER